MSGDKVQEETARARWAAACVAWGRVAAWLLEHHGDDRTGTLAVECAEFCLHVRPETINETLQATRVALRRELAREGVGRLVGDPSPRALALDAVDAAVLAVVCATDPVAHWINPGAGERAAQRAAEKAHAALVAYEGGEAEGLAAVGELVRVALARRAAGG